MVRTAALHLFPQRISSASTQPVTQLHRDLATWLSGDYQDRTFTGEHTATFKAHHNASVMLPSTQSKHFIGESTCFTYPAPSPPACLPA
jgi:hypothetical protein